MNTDIETGNQLLAQARWTDARAHFEGMVGRAPSGDALSGLAMATSWAGNLVRGIELYQQAYNAYRAEGDHLGACRACLSLCINYKCFMGNDAAAAGWLERAEVIARKGDVSYVQGWLWSTRAYLVNDSDLSQATDLIYRSLDYAAQTGDRDLELISRADLGIVKIKAGYTAEGLALVDEAMAAVSAGEHSRFDTLTVVCCIMFMACHLTSDLTRARQWLQMATRFVDKDNFHFIYAECRAYYGAMLVARGAWQDGEVELKGALETAEQGTFLKAQAVAATQLAELRIRQGRLDEAETLLHLAEHDLGSVATLAALHQARGDSAGAQALLERSLRHCDEAGIATIRSLEGLVQAQLGGSDPESASETLTRMQAVLGERSWPEAAARLQMASGHISRDRGETTTALKHFEQAVDCFAGLELPYEAAKARLAGATAALDSNPSLAAIDAQIALETFEMLGARPAADAAAALLRTLGIPTRPGPRGIGLLTRREQDVLQLVSSGLSNPEIAERLVISRKTAAHHVSSVLAKLSLRNRAEAAAYARSGEIASK